MEWRNVPIEEYKDVYKVSDHGDIVNTRSGKYLKPKITKTGYYRVNLSLNGNAKSVSVHRLVAMAFIPNPDHKATVNHKNEIKTDNRVENLEWATNAEQNIYGTRLQRARQNTDYKARNIDYKKIAEKHDYFSLNMCNRKECAVFKDGVLVGVFTSQKEAGKQFNVSPGKVSQCVSGKKKSCKGYVFKEIEEFPIAVTKRRFGNEM